MTSTRYHTPRTTFADCSTTSFPLYYRTPGPTPYHVPRCCGITDTTPHLTTAPPHPTTYPAPPPHRLPPLPLPHTRTFYRLNTTHDRTGLGVWLDVSPERCQPPTTHGYWWITARPRLIPHLPPMPAGCRLVGDYLWTGLLVPCAPDDPPAAHAPTTAMVRPPRCILTVEPASYCLRGNHGLNGTYRSRRLPHTTTARFDGPGCTVWARSGRLQDATGGRWCLVGRP